MIWLLMRESEREREREGEREGVGQNWAKPITMLAVSCIQRIMIFSPPNLSFLSYSFI